MLAGPYGLLSRPTSVVGLLESRRLGTTTTSK